MHAQAQTKTTVRLLRNLPDASASRIEPTPGCRRLCRCSVPTRTRHSTEKRSRALSPPQEKDQQSSHNEQQTGYDGDLVHRNGEMSPAFLQEESKRDEAHRPK